MTKTILFVCLGNICRSPAAEGVFLHLLAERNLTDQFVADSAGTGGWHVGNPADRRMQAAANRRGIQLPSRARQISLDDLINFDLILTMDDANLSAVQSLSDETGSRATATIRPTRLDPSKMRWVKSQPCSQRLLRLIELRASAPLLGPSS